MTNIKPPGVGGTPNPNKPSAASGRSDAKANQTEALSGQAANQTVAKEE